jgi:hypothetical protein
LQGRQLGLARLAWFAFALLCLTLLARGISLQLPLSHDSLQFGPDVANELAELHLSAEGYQAYSLAIDLLFVLGFAAVALIIFWRKTADWMAMAVSCALLLYGVSTTISFLLLLHSPSPFSFPAKFVEVLSTASVPILAYVFPDGRFVPRWTRRLAIVWAALAVAALFIPAADPDNWPKVLWALLFLFGLGSGLYAQVFRYRSVSAPEQRQQTKWVVLGFAIAILGFTAIVVLLFALPLLAPVGLNPLAFAMATKAAFYLSQLCVPLCIAFSILRYRLWDIDVLVNRTLVYSILIATLGFVFIVTTYVSERMVESLLGENSFVTSLGSAVLVAYLVDPVKKRTEHFVDRRFYRDSSEIRAAFAEITHEVRGMSDTSSLSQVLVGGVESILQVAPSDVYLREVDGSFAHASHGHAAPVQEPVVPPDPASLDRLENGRVVMLAKTHPYALLVPITLPASSGKGQASRLVGILALGSRLSGQGYSREEIAMLLTLADQAGTSLHSARPVAHPDVAPNA